MLVPMAIQMKEWGMLSTPAASVSIPTQGLMGWGDVAADLGAGLGSVLIGTSELLNERNRVTAGGELAAFSADLRKIGDETAAELSRREVKDWDYAWEQLSAPRFAEAVAGLSPQSRAAGAELASAYSMRASVMARRDREVAGIARARNNWQQRVDAAVSAGDEESADRWLQSGAQTFVPPAQLESQRNHVRNRARAARWRNAFRQDEMNALTMIQHADADSLPDSENEMRQVEEECTLAKSRAGNHFAQYLTASLLSGRTPDAAECAKARDAGIITPAQYDSAQQEICALSTEEVCEWMRRIDECPAEEAPRRDLVLSIGTAAVPVAQRADLLRRVERAAGVPAADRRALSGQLFCLYRRGVFGCPGDAHAVRRLCSLQQQGLCVLADEGSEASARWLKSLGSAAGTWVCYSDFA